jgi:hypothetical protein
VTFQLEACRLHFSARRELRFPPGMAGNVLRGTLGHALLKAASAEDYARIFAPAAAPSGPSGLADLPRPFVLRAAALDGRAFQPGEQFDFGLHLFDTRNPPIDNFIRAFAQWADFISVERTPISVDLNSRSDSISRLRVQFQTPTELKVNGAIGKSEFPVLLARARDRVSTLRSLYGEGPLELDFRGLADRARLVRTVRSELQQVKVARRSGRTGQRHGIGGFVGFAEYEGDLAEFVPYLEAAHWTGVGRHCTWGNGEICTETIQNP